MPYKDPEQQRAYFREYNRRHREKRRLYAREYYWANYEKCLEDSRQYDRKNRDKVNAYKRRKTETDLQFKLASKLRSRLRRAFKRGAKAGSAVRDLGCSIEALKSWLEYQFQPGMTWDNYGEWHIDHVKPLASFDLTDRVQFLDAVNWYNLQPLWAKDNFKKGRSHELVH